MRLWFTCVVDIHLNMVIIIITTIIIIIKHVIINCDNLRDMEFTRNLHLFVLQITITISLT